MLFLRVDRLIQCWEVCDPRPPGGARHEDLEEFEGRYGVCLPQLFRDYLKRASDFQEQGTILYLHAWNLDIIQPVLELFNRSEYPGLDRPDSLYPFADRMILEDTFCIRLTADPDESSPVWGLSGRKYTDTFDEFLQLLMTEPSKLL